MVVALQARGRTLGAMWFASAERGRYGPDDLALGEELARRAASAIDNSRLYREAQDAVRSRDEFLSIAAHELRTPVTIIMGSAQFYERARARGTLDSDRLARALRTIDEASRRLAGLISDLLDVSRIRTGQLPLEREPTDLRVLVEAVVSRYADRPDLRHQIVVSGPEASCTVLVDAHRLDQVLTNLIDNAIKYSPDQHAVAVQIAPDGEGVAIDVRDSGIGLPAASVETIFQPFGRAPNATRRQIPGLGLGLYICRTIVERHGGRIWAESAGEGSGTTMRLWLPYEDALEPAEPLAASGSHD
jgi:signal transduction histidine kinase